VIYIFSPQRTHGNDVNNVIHFKDQYQPKADPYWKRWGDHPYGQRPCFLN